MISAAQETTELLTTRLPYPSYRRVEEDHYVLRAGPLRLRAEASVSMVYTDNRNYRPDNKEDDFGILPVVNFGLYYPINRQQKLQVDVGIGYQWWSHADEQNRLYIAPNSHIDYSFSIGDVELRLSNNTSTSSEASDRPEFAGEDAGPFDVAFSRLENTTALAATWTPTRKLTLGSGYSYTLQRSLNDQFLRLDQDTHLFSGSGMYRIASALAVGISGSYSLFRYLEELQNDGESWSVGPTVSWDATDVIHVSGFLHYTETTFDRTGTVTDGSDFSGLTFGVSVAHMLNRYVTHSLSVGRQVNPGFESNFTESYMVSYALQAQLNRRLGSSLGFEYRSADTSDGFESADLYEFSVGVGYQLLSRANLGLTYAFNNRTSDLPNREYWENRVMLTASYRF